MMVSKRGALLGGVAAILLPVAARAQSPQGGISGYTALQKSAQRILRAANTANQTTVLSSPLTPTISAYYAATSFSIPLSVNSINLTQIAGLLANGPVDVSQTYTPQYVSYQGSTLNGNNGFGVGFKTDSRYFDHQILDQQGGQHFRVRARTATGTWQWFTAADTILAGTSFAPIRYKWDMGTNEVRDVQIFFDSSNAIYDVAVPGPYRIWTDPQPDRPNIIVIGDSYTLGVGSVSCHNSFPCILGERLGANVIAMGCGGTGYLNSSGGQYNFRQRPSDLTRFSNIDLVIIAGGANDGAYTSAALTAEVTAYIQLVQSTLPGVPIAVLGPWNLPGLSATSTTDTAITAGYNAAASYLTLKINSFPWFDTSGGNSTTSYYQSSVVASHPNDAGHAYIAAQIESVIVPWLAGLT